MPQGFKIDQKDLAINDIIVGYRTYLIKISKGVINFTAVCFFFFCV